MSRRCARLSGRINPRVGMAEGVLAQVLGFEDKQDESLAAARDAEHVLTGAYGEQHAMVAGTWMAQAAALVRLNRTGEARELLQKADAVFAKIYGNDNETRAKIAMNLAELETAENKFDAAADDYRRALAIVSTYGPSRRKRRACTATSRTRSRSAASSMRRWPRLRRASRCSMRWGPMPSPGSLSAR